MIPGTALEIVDAEYTQICPEHAHARVYADAVLVHVFAACVGCLNEDLCQCAPISAFIACAGLFLLRLVSRFKVSSLLRLVEEVEIC